MRERRTELLAVGGITLLALALRLAAFKQGLFGDELLTYGETRDGLSEVFEGLKRSGAEVTPPFFFVLAWASAKLGDAPELIRLPSLVFGTALVPVVYLLGRRVAGVPAGLLAAAVVALDPFALFYGTEARAYTMAMFFVALSTLALLEALDRGRLAWWVTYVVAACAACYTHYTTVFVLGVQALWALWFHRERLRELVLAHVAVAVGYLPWLPSLLDQRQKGLNIAVIGGSPVTFRSFWDTLLRTLVGHPYEKLRELPGEAALVLVGLAAAVVAGAAILELGRRGDLGRPRLDSPLLLLAVLGLTTPVGLVIYGVFGEQLFGTRNLSASVPALVVVLSALAVKVPPRAALAAAALAVAGLAVGAISFFDPDHRRPEYAEAASYLEDRAGPRDPVVASERDALNAYFERPHPVYRPAVDDDPAWEHARRGGQLFYVGSAVLARYAGTRPVAGPGNRFVRRDRKAYRGLVPLLVDRYEGMVEGRLRRAGDGESIRWTFGSDVPVTPEAAQGAVESVSVSAGELTVTGWATTRPRPGEVRWVVAFAGDRLVSLGWTPYKRPDIAQSLGDDALTSGFILHSPARTVPKGLRVFAIAAGRATELSRR